MFLSDHRIFAFIWLINNQYLHSFVPFPDKFWNTLPYSAFHLPLTWNPSVKAYQDFSGTIHYSSQSSSTLWGVDIKRLFVPQVLSFVPGQSCFHVKYSFMNIPCFFHRCVSFTHFSVHLNTGISIFIKLFLTQYSSFSAIHMPFLQVYPCSINFPLLSRFFPLSELLAIVIYCFTSMVINLYGKGSYAI